MMTPDALIPTGVPAWAWLILAALGGFVAKEFWPFIKSRFEIADKRDMDQDERFLKAFEQSSNAQRDTATALQAIAQSLDLFGRNAVALTFEMQELRREVRARARHDTPTPPGTEISPTLKKLLETRHD